MTLLFFSNPFTPVRFSSRASISLLARELSNGKKQKHKKMPALREPLQGLLFEFGSDHSRALSAFLVGNQRRVVLSVGGQVDGFFSLPFVRPLAKGLGERGWALCLPRFASSFHGSRDSHVQDATDLKDLVDLLGASFGAAEVCLFGWDTGVQVVLEYLAAFKATDLVTRVVLNGAVVDPAKAEQHCAAGQQRRKEFVEKAVAEDRRATLMPRAIYDKEMTVGRWVCGGYPTLQEAVWSPCRLGNAAAIREALAPVRTPLLVQLLPGPGYKLDKEARADADHFISSNAASTEVYVDFIDNGADEVRDLLAGTETQHVASVLAFLEAADKRRVERVEQQRAQDYESSRKARSILHNSDLAYAKK